MIRKKFYWDLPHEASSPTSGRLKTILDISKLSDDYEKAITS